MVLVIQIVGYLGRIQLLIIEFYRYSIDQLTVFFEIMVGHFCQDDMREGADAFQAIDFGTDGFSFLSNDNTTRGGIDMVDIDAGQIL